MNVVDRISSVVLLVFGMAVLGVAASYSFGSLRQPGPGFFPLIASVLLVALAAGLAGKSFRRTEQDAPARGPVVERRSVKRVLVSLASLIALRYLIPAVGFAPAVFLFVLFQMRTLSGYGWLRSVLFSLASAGAAHALFIAWLGMPMPVPLIRF